MEEMIFGAIPVKYGCISTEITKILTTPTIVLMQQFRDLKFTQNRVNYNSQNLQQNNKQKNLGSIPTKDF